MAFANTTIADRLYQPAEASTVFNRMLVQIGYDPNNSLVTSQSLDSFVGRGSSERIPNNSQAPTNPYGAKSVSISNSQNTNSSASALNSFSRYLQNLNDIGAKYVLSPSTLNSNKETNCCIAAYYWLKESLPKSLTKNLEKSHFYSFAEMPNDKRLSGAAGAVAAVPGLTKDYHEVRAEQPASEKQELLNEMANNPEKFKGALVKWSVHQGTGKLKKGTGHVAMISNIQVKRDENGNVTDILFNYTGANSPGNLGESKKVLSLENDFIEPGNSLSIAVFSDEVLDHLS